MEKILQTISGGVGLFVTAFWGGLDGVLYVLMAMMLLDYATGCAAGLLVHKNLSSEVGFKGLVKKVIILALVGVAYIVGNTLLDKGEVLRNAVCFFYIANEGLSIIENSALLGVPIPKKLKDALVQVGKDEEADEE